MSDKNSGRWTCGELELLYPPPLRLEWEDYELIDEWTRRNDGKAIEINKQISWAMQFVIKHLPVGMMEFPVVYGESAIVMGDIYWLKAMTHNVKGQWIRTDEDAEECDLWLGSEHVSKRIRRMVKLNHMRMAQPDSFGMELTLTTAYYPALTGPNNTDAAWKPNAITAPEKTT